MRMLPAALSQREVRDCVPMPGNAKPCPALSTKDASLASGSGVLLYEESRIAMFLILAIVLVVLWICGFTLMHVSSLFIHLLLLFAVVSLIMHFVTGRKTA